MKSETSLQTLRKKSIYTNDFVNSIRESEGNKKQSNIFIAQEGPQEDDLHSSVDILITGGNRGGGKANPYSTPIATPNGFVKMGDLEVGIEFARLTMVCKKFLKFSSKEKIQFTHYT